MPLVEACNKIHISSAYRHSELFDASHYIHKYYLSYEDKRSMSPVDLSALETLLDRTGGRRDCLHNCTITYSDLGVEKHLRSDQVHRALLAIDQYNSDISAELSSEEAGAAQNLNEWLSGYERTLLSQHQNIEKEMQSRLHSKNKFLVDYEIELKVQFYVHQNDLYYENDQANEHDWDKDAALMCCLRYCGDFLSENECCEGYWGIGDNQDHNNARGIQRHNSVDQVRHCLLFHQLTEHCGVPYKHLARIGTICTDFKVNHQSFVDIYLTGQSATATLHEVNPGKLKEAGNHLSQVLQNDDAADKVGLRT